ncbi:MAG: fused MFS/spermidine synthase [Desulfuromonadales bacterium]|nr:fused MFS/spermidine synthase [Desulfuromonadales bacterium]
MGRTNAHLALIYAIVFVNGAALMAFEILGSRVLAPSFGNSIFVWGSLIGVFMAGMALGYFFGGVLGDRCRSRLLFALLPTLPGLLLLVFPYYAFPLTAWLADYDLGPRFGPFLACLLLFLLPSVFLGAVSPYAIVLALHDLRRAGQSVGALYAISTVGSIAGTLGTSFYLILWLGTRSALQSIGVLLLVAGAAALFLTERRPAAAPER